MYIYLLATMYMYVVSKVPGSNPTTAILCLFVFLSCLFAYHAVFSIATCVFCVNSLTQYVVDACNPVTLHYYLY